MAMAVAVVMTVLVVVAVLMVVFMIVTVLVVMHVLMVMYVLMVVHMVMVMVVCWGQLCRLGQHGLGADGSLDFQAWAIAVRVEVGHVGVVVVLLELDREVAHIEAGLGDCLLFNAKALEGQALEYALDLIKVGSSI